MNWLLPMWMDTNIRTAICVNGSNIIPPAPSMLAAQTIPRGNRPASMTVLLSQRSFLSKQALSVRRARLLCPNHISLVVQRGASWPVHEVCRRYGQMISEAEVCSERCAVHGVQRYC